MSLLALAAGAAVPVAPTANASADEPIAGLHAVTVTSTGALAVGSHSISTFFDPLCGVNMYETRTPARWKPHTMPSPSACGWLDAVAALPHHRAWAVGYKTTTGGAVRTLTEYYNGSHWKIEPSPNPGGAEDALAGVTVTPSGTVYAVGHSITSGYVTQSLILKRTGSHWTQMTAPGGALLQGVTTTPSGQVWAVGQYFGSDLAYQTITMTLTSKGWTVVPSPSPGGDNNTMLQAVTAGKGHSLWAVGWYFDSSDKQRTLTMRYHAGTWSQVASPSPGTVDFLYGAVVAPGGAVWAVGADNTSKCQVGLTERYSGGSWQVVKSRHVGKCTTQNADSLYGVAATHSGTLYAVGQQDIYTFVEQYSGGRWKVVRSSS